MIRGLLFALLALLSQSSSGTEVFRFHLLSEPLSLSPHSSAAASGNYLFHNLYRGLYVYSRARGLETDGAESCTRTRQKLTCTLRKTKFSDGTPITSAHYLDSFRRLIDPETKSSQADVLFTIKNAREIFAGRKKTNGPGC